jgi:hypothetical protein
MKAIAQVEAEETQREKLPVMFARLFAARVRPEDYIYLSFSVEAL